MKNKFSVFLLLVCVGVGGLLLRKPAIASGGEGESLLAQYSDSRREIANYKRQQGKTLYVGEGVAEIGRGKNADLGAAIDSAKQRAKSDLLSSIRVRIRSVLKDEVKYSDSKGTTQNVERVIQSYIDQVLETVHTANYPDFPKPGEVTTIVYVEKDEYDNFVARDMQSKIDKIKKYAIEGMSAEVSHNIRQAIENYVNGRRWLNKYFDDMPVQGVVKKGSVPEDLGSYFDTRLTQIVGAIKIQKSDESIIYNTDGKVGKKPKVLFVYEDSFGSAPLSGIPAKASFSKGKGIISPEALVSGRQGEIYIPLESVDPVEHEGTLQVEFDAQSLGLTASPAMPVAFIPVRKSKAMAWAASFFMNGKREQAVPLADNIKIELGTTGYELKHIAIDIGEVPDEAIKTAHDLGVDYLVYVCLTGASHKDEYGMYKSEASGKIHIYSFYDNRLLDVVEGPAISGYSTSSSGAAKAALAKLKPGLMKTLKEKIIALK